MEEQHEMKKLCDTGETLLNLPKQKQTVSPLDKIAQNEDIGSPFKKPLSPFKVLKSPFKAPLDLNSSDLMPRESLGILSSDILARDSLGGGFHNTSMRDAFEFANISARESLGILSLSAMELGPINIFDVNNAFQKSLEENKENKVNTLNNRKGSPKFTFDIQPDIFVSTAEDQSHNPLFTDLNNGFLCASSKKLSSFLSVSSVASLVPSFNLEDMSPIEPITNSLQKDPSSISESVFTDIFNQGFQKSRTFSIQSQKGMSSENVRTRVQSFPSTFQEVGLNFVKDDATEDKDSVFVDVEPPNVIEENLNNSKEVCLDSISSPDWTQLPEEKEQNRSCGTQTSGENVSWLVKDLSDMIQDNENLSSSQKQEWCNILNTLPNVLSGSQNKVSSSSDDSGNSSVNDHQLEHRGLKEASCEATENESNVQEHPLDLSSTRKDIKLMKPGSPCPIKSTGSETKVLIKPCSPCPKECVNKNSCVGARGRTPPLSNLKKSSISVGGTVKKGPLRAIIPVENMAKRSQSTSSEPTTSKTDSGLRSKRTSTPKQELRLKPVAASTPTVCQPKSSKTEMISPLARPKWTKSNIKENSLEVSRTRNSFLALPKSATNRSMSKVDVNLFRRNSTSEGTRKVSFSPDPPKHALKRSYSVGKVPKIVSAPRDVKSQGPGLGSAYRKNNKENIESSY